MAGSSPTAKLTPDENKVVQPPPLETGNQQLEQPAGPTDAGTVALERFQEIGLPTQRPLVASDLPKGMSVEATMKGPNGEDVRGRLEGGRNPKFHSEGGLSYRVEQQDGKTVLRPMNHAASLQPLTTDRQLTLPAATDNSTRRLTPPVTADVTGDVTRRPPVLPAADATPVIAKPAVLPAADVAGDGTRRPAVVPVVADATTTGDATRRMGAHTAIGSDAGYIPKGVNPGQLNDTQRAAIVADATRRVQENGFSSFSREERRELQAVMGRENFNAFRHAATEYKPEKGAFNPPALETVARKTPDAVHGGIPRPEVARDLPAAVVKPEINPNQPVIDRGRFEHRGGDPHLAGKEFPGGSRGDLLAGREVKMPTDGRGIADPRYAQEIKGQPKEMPLPPGIEDKLRGLPPEKLAALQQQWADAALRDSRSGGDMGGMRGRMDGSEQAARLAALDALRGGPNAKGIPGFDLNDKATRDFLNDAMKRLELTKGQRIEDIFKGLDPTKADRLTKFLTEGSLDGNFNPARVKDFMGLTDHLKNPTERLYDFMKGNKDLINNQLLSPKDTQRALGDLTKILGDVNKQLGVDGSKSALTIQDILGRKLDPTRPGERLAAMDQMGIGRQMSDRAEAMAMTARMTAAQEIAIRQMLDMRNGRDPAAQAARTGQEGMAGREAGAGARFEGPQARMDAAQAAAQNAARIDVGRPDIAAGMRENIPVKAEAKPEMTVAKPESQAQRQQDVVVAPGSKPVDARADRVDPVTGLDRKDDKILDEKGRREKKEDEEKERREKEEQLKKEDKARLDALMLAALAEKKRKQLEQEQKEKEKSDEKDKQRDREKRRRYIVREKDTLQSIASQQLRDVKLAPLIYEINKEVILLRVENGKQVPDLKPKMIIWLPSTTEVEEFRKGGLAGAKAASQPDKKMTADEELIARFGTGWSGAKGGGPATVGTAAGSTSGTPTVIPGSQPATSSEVTAALAASAMEAAQKKRANIESLLGPIGRQKPADGRIKYISRLGDSLKSIAMKHPALQDVNLWKLLAEVNNLPADTDAKGTPKATLSRGATLSIPSADDIEEFRQRSTAPNSVRTTSGVSTSGAITEVATKLCTGCNRMTVASATICPACGNAFETDGIVESAAPPVTQTGRDVQTAAAGVPTQALPAEDAKTVFVASPDNDEIGRTVVTPGDQTIEQLNDVCRLVIGEGQGIIGQLEVNRGNGWEPVVSYEVYDDVSLRNEHTQDGRKRTVRIDLPPTAARELANNDLRSNWKQYCARFVGEITS
jgi:hypothetical protein